MAIETELIVKITGAGTRQTASDINSLQKSLASVAKTAKDTAATAAQLGKAFNLPDDQVAALAEALAQAKREAASAAGALATAARQFGLIGKETSAAAGQVNQLSDEVAKARNRLKESFKLRFDLDDKAAAGLIDDFQRLQKEGADLNTIFNTLGNSYGVTASQVAKVAASFGDLNQAIAAQGAAEQQLSDLQSEVTALSSDIEALQRVSENSGLDFAGAQRFAKELGLTSQQADLVIRRFRDLKGVSPEAQFQVLSRELGVTEDQFKKLERQIRDTSETAGGFNGAIAGLAAGAAFAAIDALTGALQAAGQAFLGFVANTLEVGGAAQQANVAFTTILGSAEEAQALLGELSEFAATTPFDLPGVRSAGQQLLAFGFQSDQITENLRRVGDVAAGVNTDFEGLATIYGKARVQGRLFAEDINQLTERGIPIIGELADQFGVTEAEVRSLVSEGKVGFEELEQAFISLTSEGGQFSGLMEAQSKTIPGQISNISDGFVRLQEALFDAFEPALSGGLQTFAAILAEIGEQSDGFDAIAEAAGRLGVALSGNPEIAERLGAALATVANAGVEQIALLIDAITAFVSEQDNIDAIAASIEDLATVITVAGQSARFIVALADSLVGLRESAESIPVIGDVVNFNPIDPISNVQQLIGAFTSLRNIISSSAEFIANLVSRFDLLSRNPVIAALVAQIIETDEAVGGLGSTLSGGLTDAITGLNKAGVQVQENLKGAGDAVEEEAETIEDALKRLGDTNKAALADLSTDAANARAALLEAGGDPAKLAENEAKALRDRIATNKAAFAELRALQSGSLGAEDAAAVADQIRSIEGQLASDRVSLAQQTLAEKQRTEKAAAEAAEAAAKKTTDALKAQRDEEKRIAEERQADAERAAQREFDDARDGRSEARDTQRRAEDKALQEELQADDRAFQEQRRANDRDFQQQQQAEAEAFQRSQQQAAEAFQKRLNAERDQGNREFDALDSEVDKRLQLAQADKTQRAELLKQFEEERKTLELRRQIEKEVLSDRGSVLAGEDLTLSPLEQARADFEARLQEKAAAFQEGQQLASQAFQEQQAAEAEARAEALRLEDQRRADERAAADEARAERRREQDAEFEKEERRIQDEFEVNQRRNKAEFNADQRRLDEESAANIARILAAAKPAAIDGARRDGGPVRSGGTYLVGEAGPELVTPRRGGYVHTAKETARLMRAQERGLSVPSVAGQGEVVRKLDEVLKAIKQRPAVRPQATYNLSTPTPQTDAVSMQLEEIRGLVRMGRL